MKKHAIHIKPFGEYTVLIEWPKTVSVAILDDIIRLSKYLEGTKLKSSEWELVPAYNSLTVINNVSEIEFEKFKEQVLQWYSEMNVSNQSKSYIWKLPVCYDEEFGIDLNDVAVRLNKSVSNIVKLHTQHVYTVYGIGFLPGFMYLGGLPIDLELSRKEIPRLKVVQGAVGLAAKQTGIYPQNSPGGWNIIGNCPIPIFDASKDEPCFVQVGDKVQFYPISKAEYELRKIEVNIGIYKLEKKY